MIEKQTLMLWGVIVIIIITIYKCISCQNIEFMIDIEPLDEEVKWQRNKTCKYLMGKTVKNVIDKNDFNATSNDNWNMYFPCTYNNIGKEISDIKLNSENKRIFIIDNADQLSSKNGIWKNMVSKFGRDKACLLMPKTYILHDKKDTDLLIKEFKPNNLYILKKNIQRQEGLKITNDLYYMLEAKKKGYVIAQDLLQNPYKIDGRKTNMRLYLLIICNKGEIGAYVHKDGFMYYTKVPFKKNSLEPDDNITTGYIDREVYERNPLTLMDFRQYLDTNDRTYSKIEQKYLAKNMKLSDLVFGRIHYLIKLSVESIKPVICQNNKLTNHITYQLFGMDVALNDMLIPQIIEVNKGPDLGAKDGRDSDVKHKVVEDVFKTIKVLHNDDNEFIEIV